MPKKRLGAEQIVTKLRQVEVLQSQGKTVAAACKQAALTEQSYYRYRKEYVGLNNEQTPLTSVQWQGQALTSKSPRGVLPTPHLQG